MGTKAVNKESGTQRESFTELLGQLANNSAAVIHEEIELLIQRFREKVKAVRSGVLTVVVGGVISFAAFISLCAALIVELTSCMTPVMAALIVGAALALIGVVIAFIGYKKLKKTMLKS
jgi:VIT1/CCC1 family predicted Fe2+/Mn2+ transporter